mgnify:CR=1 FL=1
MIKESVYLELIRRIESAEVRYGAFVSTHEALGVALEEWNELQEAVWANGMDQIRDEALDLAAVCLRLADQIGNAQLRGRSMK